LNKRDDQAAFQFKFLKISLCIITRILKFGKLTNFTVNSKKSCTGAELSSFLVPRFKMGEFLAQGGPMSWRACVCVHRKTAKF
jgi:hypothetical protein